MEYSIELKKKMEELKKEVNLLLEEKRLLPQDEIVSLSNKLDKLISNYCGTHENE